MSNNNNNKNDSGDPSKRQKTVNRLLRQMFVTRKNVTLLERLENTDVYFYNCLTPDEEYRVTSVYIKVKHFMVQLTRMEWSANDDIANIESMSVSKHFRRVEHLIKESKARMLTLQYVIRCCKEIGISEILAMMSWTDDFLLSHSGISAPGSSSTEGKLRERLRASGKQNPDFGDLFAMAKHMDMLGEYAGTLSTIYPANYRDPEQKTYRAMTSNIIERDTGDFASLNIQLGDPILDPVERYRSDQGSNNNEDDSDNNNNNALRNQLEPRPQDLATLGGETFLKEMRRLSEIEREQEKKKGKPSAKAIKIDDSSSSSEEEEDDEIKVFYNHRQVPYRAPPVPHARVVPSSRTQRDFNRNNSNNNDNGTDNNNNNNNNRIILSNNNESRRAEPQKQTTKRKYVYQPRQDLSNRSASDQFDVVVTLSPENFKENYGDQTKGKERERPQEPSQRQISQELITQPSSADGFNPRLSQSERKSNSSRSGSSNIGSDGDGEQRNVSPSFGRYSSRNLPTSRLYPTVAPSQDYSIPSYNARYWV